MQGEAQILPVALIEICQDGMRRNPASIEKLN